VLYLPKGFCCDGGESRGLLRLDAARHAHPDLVQAFADSGDATTQLTPTWATIGQDSPALRHTLTGHTNAVVAVASMVLPDGAPVAVTTSDDGTARVWDLSTGRLRHTLMGSDLRLRSHRSQSLRCRWSARRRHR
jgi:WD40 repeat protein